MDPSAGFPTLAARIAAGFGVDVALVEAVDHGADPRADLVHVVATDGREYAAKSSIGPQPGLAVAALLARHRVPGVPGPVPARDGGLTAGADGDRTRLSLVPWVRGRRVLDTGMAPGEWMRLGALLGRVHTTSTNGSELSAVPVETHDPTAVVEQAQALGVVVEHAVRASVDDPVAVEAAALWEAHGPRLLAVADRAAQLASSCAWAEASFVLCHGDPHHGNLLVDESGEVHLIDWDDAVVAPRESDLMFVVGGVFSHSPITDDQVRWFFDGYAPLTGIGLDHLDHDLLTYLRSVRALVDVLDLLAAALAVSDHPPGDRREALHYARGTLGPNGLVDLALA
ncbi:phosphotransferase [Pedococcus sp. KACC 23699]|uniref:Phosphotransferase n=1 Tax=Pedococcus sp. KACC 23699 TaxID=3149228 RepID=A0AAU7JYM6_9MICO